MSDIINNEENKMAVLTCYFNWCNYKTPSKNLHAFINRMKEQEIPVYGMELSLTNNFETQVIPNWIQVRVDEKNIAFQKEACINKLERSIPKDYKKIAWIDADVEFKNPNWYKDTIEALDRYKIVQMFSEVSNLDENNQVLTKKPSLMRDGKPLSSAVFENTEPGKAWAARRELWENGGLYPYNFLGDGDTMFAFSALNLGMVTQIKDMGGLNGLNENCKKFYDWKKRIIRYIERNVGFVDGEIVHSWHGEERNRKSESKYEIYKSTSIDTDMIVGEHGILDMTNVSESAKTAISMYFKNRLEDGEKPLEAIENTNSEVDIIAQQKIVVYTCITENYDNLKEIEKKGENIDYVCFSDKEIMSNTWEIRKIPKILSNLGAIKTARCIKVLPHLFLSDYDISVWVDASIEIVGDVREFIKNNLDGCFAVSRHPNRNCIYDEASVVIDRKKDTASAVLPQILKYKEKGYPKSNGLVQTGILVRRHNLDECKELCNEWWSEIVTGSRRDQLSFNYVIWKKRIQIDTFHPNEFSGKYFQLWTHAVDGLRKLEGPRDKKYIKNYINGMPI